MIPGYSVENRQSLRYPLGELLELRHEATGARHVHIATDDTHAAFALLIPTANCEHRGIAHAVEHLVGCGSRRYPVDNAFYHLMARGRTTYLNNATGPDWTIYAFATRDPEEYARTLDVYLDGVFFPRLDQASFDREVHRVELDDVQQGRASLCRRGVVLSEGRQAMASPTTSVEAAIGASLYPSLSYAFRHGGDPLEIPKLSLEDASAFHAERYHPSNSYFYSYGAVDLKATLKLIERAALGHFDRRSVASEFPRQAPFDEPISVRHPLPASMDSATGVHALVGWVTAHASELIDVWCLRVLKEMLLGDPTTLLYRALIRSGLGRGLALGTGLHAGYRQLCFVAGLRDVHPGKVKEVEQLIGDALANSDFQDSDQVVGAINRLKLALRKVEGTGRPCGLEIFQRIAPLYADGGDVSRVLRFDGDLAQVAEMMTSTAARTKLIDRWLVGNPHRATIVLEPDPTFHDRRAKAERIGLEEHAANLTDEQWAVLPRTSRHTEAQSASGHSSQVQTRTPLPVPCRTELVREILPHPTHASTAIRGVPCLLLDGEANGIDYVELRLDLSRLPAMQLKHLPLLAYVLPRCATGDRGYPQTVAATRRDTGGVTVRVDVRQRAHDEVASAALLVSGNALAENRRGLFDVLRDLLLAPRFAPPRVKGVLTALAAQLGARVSRAGSIYGTLLAAAPLGPVAALEEKLKGFTALGAMGNLANASDDSLEETCVALEMTRRSLVRRSNLAVYATTQDGRAKELGDQIEALVRELADDGPEAQVLTDPVATFERRDSALVIPGTVAYNAIAFRAPAFVHTDSPALAVLAHYLELAHLFAEIRNQGGAYGVRAAFEWSKGYLVLASFSDPNVPRTFECFASATRRVAAGEVDETLIDRARAQACATFDSSANWRWHDVEDGYTTPRKQRFRDALLEVTGDQLVAVAGNYLNPDEGVRVTLAPTSLIESSNRAQVSQFSIL